MKKRVPHMKKMIMVISLLAMWLVSAGPGYQWLVELTVINKSGMAIEISMQDTDQENIYYLRIPQGDMTNPAEKTYTVVRATYTATLYYVELWDPVYGYSCSSKSQSIDAQHKVKVVVFPCNKTISQPGSAVKIKFGAPARGRHGRAR
jgi:hypothetical protein